MRDRRSTLPIQQDVARSHRCAPERRDGDDLVVANGRVHAPPRSAETNSMPAAQHVLEQLYEAQRGTHTRPRTKLTTRESGTNVSPKAGTRSMMSASSASVKSRPALS